MTAKKQNDAEQVLRDWRARILNNSLATITIMSLPAFAAIAIQAIADKRFTSIAMAFSAFELVLIALTLVFRGIRTPVRVAGLLSVAYAVAIYNIYLAGLNAGSLYLLAAPIIALILIGRRAGILTTAISVSIATVWTILVHQGWVVPVLNPASYNPWIGLSTMLMLVIVVMSMLILFYRFQERLIDQERSVQVELMRTQALLEEQNASLETSVKERTEALVQSNRIQTAIFNITEAASASQDRQEFFTHIHRIVGELMYAKNFFIALYDESSGLLSFPYFVDERDEPFATQPLANFQGMSSYIIRTGEPIPHGPHHYKDLLARNEAALVGTENEDGIGAPLKVDGKTIGALYVQSYTKGTGYTDQDDEILTYVAQHIATALARFRSLEAERQRTSELSIINRVQEALASQLDLQAIYELIGEKVREVFRVHVVDIVVYDPSTHLFTMPYSYEKGDRSTFTPREPFGLRLEVMKSRSPLLINRNFVEVARQYDNPLITGDWPKSALFVPLVVGEKVKGIISIQDLDRENAFSDSDLRLLQTLANAVGIAIENARLFDETQHLLKETEQRNAELAIINSVQSGLTADLDFQAISELIGKKLQEIFASPNLVINWYDAKTNLVHYLYAYERGERMTIAPQPLHPDGILHKLITTRQAGYLEYGGEKDANTPILPGTEACKSGIAVPIICNDRVLGVIQIEHSECEHAYSDSELRLLTTVAASLGAAIENVQLAIQRNEAIEALRQSEERYRLITENIDDVIWTTDADDTLTYISPSIRKLRGIEPEEAMREMMPRAFTPASFQVLRNEYDRVRPEIEQGKDVASRLEVEQYRKDGSIVWIEISRRTMRDGAGRLTGFVGVSRDIAERKRTEQALYESERRLADIIDFLPIATMVIDSQGRVTAWNQAIEKMTGVKSEGIVGKGNYEYALPFCGNRTPILIDLVFAPEAELDARYKHIKRDGGILSAESLSENIGENGRILIGFTSALYDSDGRVSGAIESISDVTDLRQAEAELNKAKEAAEAANRSKSAFLANMSHEIRTPMNAILGFAQLMQRDPDLSSRQREHLDVINRSGEHLLALINEILELSKIEAGRSNFVPGPFDLDRLLDDLEMMFRVRTDEKKLWLTMEKIDTVPRWVVTDEGKLRQVLINLLGNAVKFTKEGGIGVRVGTLPGQSGKDLLSFEIEDTGSGISADEIQNLYTAFEQTSAGREMGGTGLGLALSRGFVQIMGGTISASSTIGRGSVFSFSIPFEKGEEQPEQKAVPKRVVRLKPDQAEIRILVADDRETNRRFLTSILSLVGFKIREAADGGGAVAAFHEWKPRIILMDLAMPVMSGYEATRMIRASPEGNDTIIIAISASAFKDDRQRALEAGADSYLSKPFKEADLFETIHRLGGADFSYDEREVGEQAIVEEDSPAWRDAIAALPADLASQCRAAAERADIFLLLDLLAAVSDFNPSIAHRLNDLAGRFDYEAIIKLLTPGE